MEFRKVITNKSGQIIYPKDDIPIKKCSKALDLKEMNTIHICFAKTDFKCPYCQKEYDDLDDKYVNRCNRNKYGWTKIKCSCGKWFGMAYNIKEEAVGFEI